jgi:cysteine desulfurase / selenocysteine lyase
LLEQLTPMQFGGNMIAEVSFEKTTLNDLPFRLEAGTPHIEGVIGLRAAIEYVNKQNWDDIKIHETNLRLELETQLSEIKDLQILGQAKHKGPMTTFAWKGVHPSDLAQILDQENVAIRAGHLCAQPLLKRFSVPAFARASLSIYNQSTDVTAFITALRKAEKMLKE